MQYCASCRLYFETDVTSCPYCWGEPIISYTKNKETIDMDAEDIRRKESALKTLLNQMDVPTARRDVASSANLRWLLRNLGIKNKDHAMFSSTMALAKSIYKERRQPATNRHSA